MNPGRGVGRPAQPFQGCCFVSGATSGDLEAASMIALKGRSCSAGQECPAHQRLVSAAISRLPDSRDPPWQVAAGDADSDARIYSGCCNAAFAVIASAAKRLVSSPFVQGDEFVAFGPARVVGARCSVPLPLRRFIPADDSGGGALPCHCEARLCAPWQSHHRSHQFVGELAVQAAGGQECPPYRRRESEVLQESDSRDIPVAASRCASGGRTGMSALSKEGE